MKIARIIFLLLGAAILTALIERIGVATLWQEIAALGWWSAGVVLISAAWYLSYTAAWRLTLRKVRFIGLWPMFRIKIVGETVNTLTPANFVGGDPVRIYFLKRYFPWTHGAASVVIDRTLQAMATILVVFAGAAIAFWHIPNIPTNVHVGLPIVVSISLGFIAWVFMHQRRGLLTFGMNLARRLRIKRHFSEKTIQRCSELDGIIANFYTKDPRGFWAALSLHGLGRFLGIAEIYLVGHLANAQFGWTEALILGALAPMINIIFSFVPAALGIMEGAYSGVLYLMNFSPTLGISIQIIKRLRAFFWIGLGFIFMSTHDRRTLWEADEDTLKQQYGNM